MKRSSLALKLVFTVVLAIGILMSVSFNIAKTTQHRVFEDMREQRLQHDERLVALAIREADHLKRLPPDQAALEFRAAMRREGLIRGRLLRPPHPPRGAFLLFLLIAGLVLLPPIYFLAIRPIRKLSDVAQRLAAGDLDTPIKISGTDEFAQLGEQFDHMRLELAERLEEKERLLQDISHELRAPLTRLRLALSLAGPDAPQQGRMEGDVKVMEALVDDLLSRARSRGGSLNLEALDLSLLSRELASEHEITVRDRRLVLEQHMAEAPCEGDRVLVRRAMDNLLKNALDYTPAGGIVRLETSRDGGWSLFRVVDTGPGIPQDAQARIFEPFYRPDPSRTRKTGGAGLGLAIAKSVAERHGGDIRLASGAGGTTVELRLPIRKEA